MRTFIQISLKGLMIPWITVTVMIINTLKEYPYFQAPYMEIRYRYQC